MYKLKSSIDIHGMDRILKKVYKDGVNRACFRAAGPLR